MRGGDARAVDASDEFPGVLRIPYARRTIEFSIPAGSVRELRCAPRGSPVDLALALSRDRLGAYAESGTLWIVNDGTRPTPTRTLIETIRPTCDILVATGAHAAPTEEQLRFILGPDRGRRPVAIHDARRSPCRSLGVTSRGTPVHLNQRLFDYERILVFGSVEPHYFAGFTGGRKGLVPGVAAFETIEANHSLYFQRGVGILQLAGNPVHEDMVEAVRMLDADLRCINTVVAPDGDVVSLHDGDLHEALAEAAPIARACFTVPLDEPADLVIACAPYPMDVDLYQSQKALLNAARACAAGGTIALVSACHHGIGPRAFYDLVLDRGGLCAAEAHARAHYRLGYHKVASFAEILATHAVKAITELNAEDLRPLGIERFASDDLQRAIAAVHAAGGSILCLPEASVTVPTRGDEPQLPWGSGSECGSGVA
jgi:nickel-dependent lactate racemase